MADSYKQQALAWVRTVIAETGLSAAALARKAGLQSSTLTRPLNNPDHPHALSGRTIAAIARATGRDAPRWAGGLADPAFADFAADLDLGLAGTPPRRRGVDIVLVPENPLTDPAETATPVALWPFDRRFLTAQAADTDALVVFAAIGASPFGDGDRVVVNRNDKRLMSAGVFALWDGEAVVFRRVERLPAPRGLAAKVLVSAGPGTEREMEADWLDPVGRALTLVRRLPQ